MSHQMSHDFRGEIKVRAALCSSEPNTSLRQQLVVYHAILKVNLRVFLFERSHTAVNNDITRIVLQAFVKVRRLKAHHSTTSSSNCFHFPLRRSFVSFSF